MSTHIREVESRHLAASVYSAGALLIAIGVFLRLAFLGTDSFWLDEAYSVTHVVPLTFSQIWRNSPDPQHPPLYFVILKMALQWLGTSETVARLPSALASIGNLALVAVLGRRLGLTAKASGVAMLLMALAPLDVWYAQEARMYELVTTAALLFAIGLTAVPLGAVLAAFALAAGLYIEFTMVALFALVLGLWLVRWWHTGRRRGEFVLVSSASVAGWLLFQPEWAHLGQILSRINSVPLLVNLRRTIGLTVTPGSPAIVTMVVLAALTALAAAAIWLLLRRDAFVRAWIVIAPAAFIAATIASAIPRAYSAKQFLVTGWPFVTLVVAWTIVDAPDRIQSVANRPSSGWQLPSVAVVSLAAAIITVVTPRADWRSAVRYLNQRAARTEDVWLDPPWNEIPYGYYRPEQRAHTSMLPFVEANPDAVGKTGQICVVAERFGSAPPTSATEAWLDAHLRLADSRLFPRLEVRCYSR